MSSEGNFNQSLSDKKYQYFGSQRLYYVGSTIGSTSLWSFLNFSGTDTGFGMANNVLSQRITIAASGGNTTRIEVSYTSGVTLDGEYYPGETHSLDGINRSGVWIRTNAAGQLIRIWAL